MTSSSAPWIVAGFVFLFNLPFGSWRAGVPKFSWRWFLAVHAAVPFAFGVRVLFGVGWSVRLVPLFVGAYFGGQFLGGRARRLKSTGSSTHQELP